MVKLPESQRLFPTFSSFISAHKKLTIALFSLYFATIALAVSIVALSGRQVTTTKGTDGTSVAAYGMQRLIFVNQDGLKSLYVADKKIAVSSSSDGVNWQESPLSIPDSAENVSGAWDNEGNLHLAYESEGRVFYRKVGGDWSASNSVILDASGFAHRPSLVLENNLPAVAWSSEGKLSVRASRVLFLRARSDPTAISNWCNAKRDFCGKPAYVNNSGSSDVLGIANFPRTLLHPKLVRMPQTGDLYLFYSIAAQRGTPTLSLVIAKKSQNLWEWEKVRSEGEIGEETFRNFNLAAAEDNFGNQVVTSYTGKDGDAKVVSYKPDGGKIELSSTGSFGSQFALSAGPEGRFLVYRTQEGKIALVSFDTNFSGVLWESQNEGFYPSIVQLSGKILLTYTTTGGNVEYGSYSTQPVEPTETPVATGSSLPSSAPTP